MKQLLLHFRWLLLGFKREFSFLDSLRCFEILSSHHLELGSLVAERVLMMEEMNEFANTGKLFRQCEKFHAYIGLMIFL